MNDAKRELARPVLAVLAILAMIVASFWILRPFLGALVWAATIVVATWPLLTGLQRKLWGRRGLAVTVLSLVLLGVLFVPFVFSVGAIVANADAIETRVQSLSGFQVPPLPQWAAGLPLVGEKLSLAWDKIVGKGIQELVTNGAPYAGQATKWLLAKLGGVGLALFQFLLTVIIAAILWSSGEKAAAMLRRYARRLAGERGEGVVHLAGQAIRGVALGVVVTAVVQSILCGLGLFIAGVPFATLLTAAMFILCIAQVGPILVMVGAVIWGFTSAGVGWGVFLIVWTIITGPIDNILRPVLIKKGADLPLLLVFVGVIGGLVAFGLIGIFVGPVVLAVTHTLAEAWAADEMGPA